MPDDFVTVAFPPGADSSLRIRCTPAGKRRFSAWLNHEFLGHAIARVDGTWTGKAPHEETFPGCADRDAALLGLLELRSRVQALILDLQAPELKKVSGGMRDFRVCPTSPTSSPSPSSAGP
jgi:hypothetical protein